MGHRSNYIIIENNHQTIYYAKWDAQQLGYNLAFGPIDLLDYIRTSTDGIEDYLLNEVWSEGSMILNFDKKEVLFYDALIGSESVFLKDALIEMYTQTSWKGWSIRWAMNGQAEIADYLGIPRESVLQKDISVIGKPKYSPDFPQHLYSTLLILVNEENVTIKLLPWYLETFLNIDYEDAIEVQKNLDSIEYTTLDRSYIYEFVLIDRQRHSIEVFYSYPRFIEEKLYVLSNLKNWQVTFKEEGYKWLDSRLGIKFELKTAEIQNVKECLDHVFFKRNFSSYEHQKKFYEQVPLELYQTWLLKSPYYS